MKDCEEIGLPCELHKLPEYISQTKYLDEIVTVSKDFNNKIILQKPVPQQLNPEDALGAAMLMGRFLSNQDVDGMFNDVKHKPCTPRGIMDWLNANNIEIDGKVVTIIGRSDLVGRPLAKMMLEANATVIQCHSHTPSSFILEAVIHSDIIVSAIGKPKYFHWDIPELYRTQKKIFIDVGINRDENGKLCGDMDYDKLTAEGFYVTPVPGGVGLLTRVALLKNCLDE